MPGIGEKQNISSKQRIKIDLPITLLSSGHCLNISDWKSQNGVIFLIPRENAVPESIILCFAVVT